MRLRRGELTIEAEPAKRRGLRWAVGSPTGPRSATWRLWGNKKGDVYLAVRCLGGIVKTSLHRDGRCHTGFTAPYEPTARVRFPALSSRHWDRWELPAEPVARAIQIVVPEAELVPFDGSEMEQTKWIPAPPVGSISVVTIFVAERGAVPKWPAEEHGAYPIGFVSSPLRTAWAVYTVNAIDASTNGVRAAEKSHVLHYGNRRRSRHTRCSRDRVGRPGWEGSVSTRARVASDLLTSYNVDGALTKRACRPHSTVREVTVLVRKPLLIFCWDDKG
jgi:hypothetical protein